MFPRPLKFDLESFLRKHLVPSKEPEADEALIAELARREQSPVLGTPSSLREYLKYGTLEFGSKVAGVSDENIIERLGTKDVEWHQLAELVERQTPVQNHRSGPLSTVHGNIAYVGGDYVAAFHYGWKMPDRFKLSVRKRFGQFGEGQWKGKPCTWAAGIRIFSPAA